MADGYYSSRLLDCQRKEDRLRLEAAREMEQIAARYSS